MGQGMSVQVDGLVTARNLLKQLDANVLKQMDRELTSVAREVQANAAINLASLSPHSAGAYRVRTTNRQTGFSKSITTTAGTVAKGERWSSKPGALAAIFEFAEKPSGAKPQNVARTQKMIATVASRAPRPEPGRFLWAAYDAMQPDVNVRTIAVVDKIEDELRKALS